jgi:hypothetical protein
MGKFTSTLHWCKVDFGTGRGHNFFPAAAVSIGVGSLSRYTLSVYAGLSSSDWYVNLSRFLREDLFLRYLDCSHSCNLSCLVTEGHQGVIM